MTTDTDRLSATAPRTTDGVNLTGFWRRSTLRSTCGPWSGTSSAYATSSARPSSNRAFLMQCKGTPFEQFVHQAMTKVRMMLPQSIEVNLERALDTVSFHAEPLRGEEVEVAGRRSTRTTSGCSTARGTASDTATRGGRCGPSRWTG